MDRIAMINTVCSGSHGRIMRDLQTSAENAGLDALLAYGRGTSPVQGAVRFDSDLEIYLHGALSCLLDAHARGSLAATRRLIRMLEKENIRMVHLHNLHGYYINAPLLFSYLKLHDLPVIWTLHDCWSFTGHCSHFVRADCLKWQEGCHDCPLKSAYPSSMLLDRSAGNYRWKRETFSELRKLTIVTPSHWLAEQVRASFLKEKEIRVIPNGVDIAKFTPASPEDRQAVRHKLGIPEGKKLFLSVASPFDERKGFSDIIRIANECADRALVVMVGLNDKQMRSLSGPVIGLRRTETPEELITLYSAADCLINATYEDTYPTVNMESVACGTPVACYGVCGCPEQLDGAHGETVPAGDFSALAACALRLAEKKPLLEPVCRRKAEHDFDRADCLKAYEALYKSILAKERISQ